MPKLGIIAGQGAVCWEMVQSCKDKGADYVILALKGQTDPDLVQGHPHRWVRPGALGEIIRYFKTEGVTTVALAGGIGWPGYLAMRPDWTAAKVFAKIWFFKLDFSEALRVVVAKFEEEGLHFVGVK